MSDQQPVDQSDRIEQILEQSAQREESAFVRFLQLYERSNPRPNFAWFTRISAFSIISLMTVAALRTAFSFFISAFMSLNKFMAGYIDPQWMMILSVIEALAAIAGIEGFIVAAGMKRGMDLNEEDLKTPSAIASGILLVVSCLAGILQGSSMITMSETVATTIEVVLAIAAGIGVPVAIYFAAPYLGLILNYQFIQDKNWLNDARRSFENSKERKLARRELTAVQEVKRVPTQEQINERITTKDVVEWYRKEHGLTPGQDFGASEAASAWFKSRGIDSPNGQFAKLAGAIRTYQSRERDAQS